MSQRIELEIRPVTVNLDRHSHVPTIQVKLNNQNRNATFMLDTGSGPNIIKENLISDKLKIDYGNILRLNGINDYPVYTLGRVIIPLFIKQVIFHIVSKDFPISQAGILGNDFFKQTNSRIDYAEGHLEISGERISFSTPETITVPPQGESLFFVRISNPEIEVGYVPRMKVVHGIYLGDTVATNEDGKTYLNIISTLSEPIEVQVPTIQLLPLSEMQVGNIEKNNEEWQTVEMSRDSEVKKIYDEENHDSNDLCHQDFIDEKFLEDKIQKKIKKREKNKIKITQEKDAKTSPGKNLNEINDGGNFQTPSKEEKYINLIAQEKDARTSPGNIINKEVNLQASQKKSKISKNSTPINHKKGNFQTSLRDLTSSDLKMIL
ncbi:hypothetical protein PUN28_012870 [Cardiocondyla obscurior]|uniref:Retropepsins domain-containing protein n=1 Tax=Cardiocondyla obscurior TaxID=286306 RepID=A0AAW2F923_9HYME